MEYPVYILGVSGTGKTSVGQALAQRLQLPFLEGDDFHPDENVAKMRSGIPLNDEDRWPWLTAIATSARRHLQSDPGVVIACSGLKKAYRDYLRERTECDGTMVLLTGSRELLTRRHSGRTGHFMPPSLLDSQLATLELPEPLEDVIEVDIQASVDDIVKTIISALQDRRRQNSES